MRKKILFFLESLGGGGAEKVLSDIVSNLDSSKYDVTVCTVTDEGVYEEKVSRCCNYRSFLNVQDYRDGGIRKALYRLQMKLIYFFPSKLIYRLYIRDKYDVEIAFIEGYATKLIAASSNKKSRKLAWIHTDMEQNSYADNCYFDYKAHRSTYKKFDKILCVSQSVKNAFERKFFESLNVQVQYNPVDEQEIERKATEKTDVLFPKKKILLGTIGRLEHQKGYLRLTECAASLKEKGYDFVIWIIGQGSLENQLKVAIKQHNLENNIKLLGFQKNPYKYMNCCDAFICSSYAEGFSTAATESLILGKPIFTVECAGMQELFGDAKCGEIVENTDEALLKLLEDIVSGKIQIADYRNEVLRRKAEFSISERIKEIEGELK